MSVFSTPPVAWTRVIIELERCGFNSRTMAYALDTPRTTILGWKNTDAEPRHADGERLICLWQEATGKPRDALPRKPSRLQPPLCIWSGFRQQITG